VIDIHSHLLPGVDDGSPNLQVSVSVLERFAQQGVRTLVLTPHLEASRAASAPYERHVEIFETLLTAAPPFPALKLGWEIMLDVPGVDLSAPNLSLGGSNAVLVEFPRNGVPAAAAQELARLRASGVIPIVAHPERYLGCTVHTVAEWRDAGAAIQTDATMLLGAGPMARLAQAMLAEGLVDCLASDNHGDSRTLAAARVWLEEMGAAEQASILTSTNAGRLLANEAPLPVAPVRPEKGMFSRLRELVFGRR
jgi:protein-tyrosine phosphatase